MVNNPPPLTQWRNFRLTPLELLVLVLALLGIIFLLSLWVQPNPVNNSPSLNIDGAMNEHLIAQEAQTNEAINNLRRQQEDLRARLDRLERQLANAGAPAAPISAPPKVHIVQAGETLSALANKYKISLDNLMRWNNLKANSRLRAGQELRLSPQ
jgi:hypothetical protein